ncbi:MAG: porphobilinogen synthase [Caldisericia bacterium]|nr:porphobilinogen synthase [Caldisericia bacterium]
MFPMQRMRRLRKNSSIRAMVRQNSIELNDLILPLFVTYGKNKMIPISSMPGVYQYSVENIVKKAEEAYNAGIPAIILFGIPETKDKKGTMAFSQNGIVQKAVKEIKNKIPSLIIITDVCLCGYTTDGHCGFVNEKGIIENDSSCEQLAKIALSHVQAGADIVAPSDMMDGRVKYIRSLLDTEGFQDSIIMSYAVKYASSYYGPFREAADCAPKKGNRKTYQMDPANSREAIREAELDIKEGADLLIIKPALAYLDIICKIRNTFNIPLVSYNVSGEYAMLKAASEKGWIDYSSVLEETLVSMKRAGSDMIITYSAMDMARLINGR